MTGWSDRPIEERTLFNPAFLALIIFEAARGHREESDEPLPFPLTFLSVALATHDQVVESLPTIATSMFAWLNQAPLAQLQVAARARELVPATREAIRLGAHGGLIAIGKSGEISNGSLQLDSSTRPLKQNQSVKGSHFIGRWMARAGDPVTTLAAWGLRV
jgi:hypothetical protein